MKSLSLWIIDLGAYGHISSNNSLFSYISSPKFSHSISLANGSKVDYQRFDQVLFYSFFKLKSCPNIFLHAL